jgi:hypothetical protein
MLCRNAAAAAAAAAAAQESFFQQQKCNITMKIDIVEFIKTSGKIVDDDSPDPNKELVTLINFTGTVSWKKQSVGSSHGEAGIEQDTDEVEFIKDVKPAFPLQPTLQGGMAGIMKTGIGAMGKWSAASAPPVKPKTVVVKVEKVGPGPKKASFTKELEQPKKSIIISNAVKPPSVAVVKPSIKNKPATKKMEQPLDYSLLSHLSKAKAGTKGMENSSSSSESTDSSFNRHHASLFAAAGRSEKQDEVANLETLVLMDDKEEKKAADDEVVDTVIQTTEPKKARGRPAAAVAAPAAAPAAPAAAAASNKNKKNNNNNNKNKVNDAPPRRTRGAAARK